MKKYKNHKKYKRRKYSYIDCQLNYPLKQRTFWEIVNSYTDKSAKSALNIKNLVWFKTTRKHNNIA